METIQIPVKVKHLLNSEFAKCEVGDQCSLDKAVMEHLGITHNHTEDDIRSHRLVDAAVVNTWIKGEPWSHKRYGPKEWKEDVKIARKSDDPETIVRTITMIKRTPATKEEDRIK